MKILPAFAALVLLPAGYATVSVDVALKPEGPWKPYATRTLDDLPAVAKAQPDAGLTRYGGSLARKETATGFFHATKRGARWWLVDPEGALYLDKSVVSVGTVGTPGAAAALRAKFGDEAKWAARTTAWLRELGFTGVGAWSDTERLRAVAPSPLVYTRIWNFMSAYGKKRGGTFQQPGHTGYPKDCIFVFDPAFAAFCDEYARQLASAKDDPWLFGHFTDNELPMKREALANYLSLPDSDPGQRAAQAWLRTRHGAAASAKDITEQDRQDFLALVVDRYLRIVVTAMRKHDPNHLILGPRLHGGALNYPEVLRACGPYLDVVALNYYHAWTPDAQKLAMWERESGKPFIITEWYAKGMDAVGLANTSGAGWVVKTQRDRGRFYENFTLGLLESKGCVGWHWFKYADNDPDNLKTDPSNRDSNKGMVTNRYESYPGLIASMQRINQRAYQLAEYFEAPSASAATPAIRIVKDVTFLEPGRAEKLDLYLPEPPAEGSLSPGLVWIHGGGWMGGEKGEARAKEICGTLAQAGYVVVSLNYTLGADAWPTNLLDCKNGVRFLRAHAAEYHLDPARIAVAGGSAGGHLALMVAFTTGQKELEPGAPYAGLSSAVGCVIDMYGPANILTRKVTSKSGEPSATRKLMGKSLEVFRASSDDADVLRYASPVTHVTRNSPPVLILHGRADPTVDYEQSEELARTLKQHGVEHEFILLEGVGHTFDWETWNRKPLPRDLRPVALDFLARHLRLDGAAAPAARP